MTIKKKILPLIKKLNEAFIDTSEEGTNTDDINAEHVLTDMLYLENDDKTFVIQDTFEKLNSNDQVASVFSCYESMNNTNQGKFLSLIGSTFNEGLYKQSKLIYNVMTNTDILELTKLNKKEFFEQNCDKRLQQLLSAMIAKSK